MSLAQPTKEIIKIPNSASSANFPSAGRDLSWSGCVASSVSNRLLQLGVKHLWCSLVYLQKCKKPCCFEHRINQTAGHSFFNTALWASTFFQGFSSASSPQSNSSLHAPHCHRTHLKNLMELAKVANEWWHSCSLPQYETDCLDCRSSAVRIWWWPHWDNLVTNATCTFS